MATSKSDEEFEARLHRYLAALPKAERARVEANAEKLASLMKNWRGSTSNLLRRLGVPERKIAKRFWIRLYEEAQRAKIPDEEFWEMTPPMFEERIEAVLADQARLASLIRGGGGTSVLPAIVRTTHRRALSPNGTASAAGAARISQFLKDNDMKVDDFIDLTHISPRTFSAARKPPYYASNRTWRDIAAAMKITFDQLVSG